MYCKAAKAKLAKNPEDSVTPNFSTRLGFKFWEKGAKSRKPGFFSIKDPKKLARSIADSHRNMGKFSYESKPLTSIEFMNCVADNLHTLLRITDKLEQHFINGILEAGI